jgi:succinate-semialdehyde dehydrogenase/glutarate-semialdehyde dehydrogenase
MKVVHPRLGCAAGTRLGGSVITRDVERGTRVARQIETGMVFINTARRPAPDLPFGGGKNPGYGRELSDLGGVCE